MTSPIEKMLEEIEYTPIPDAEKRASGKFPYATHEGILKIGEAEFKVYQLNTGQRVIDEEDLVKFLNQHRPG